MRIRVEKDNEALEFEGDFWQLEQCRTGRRILAAIEHLGIVQIVPVVAQERQDSLAAVGASGPSRVAAQES